MKHLLSILLISTLFAGELEVDGNLKVTGTIQNDSLAQVIAQLEARIAQLECTNSGNIPTGYCDCFGNVLDACGICGGDAISEEECYITDIDGNTYEFIHIGDQIWMKENLKVTQYRNGNTLNSAIDLTPNYLGTYGSLYTYEMVVSGNALCMEGWHVPSDAEFKQLEIFLGMSPEQADIEHTVRGTDEGGKLKEEGLDHWASPNVGATNESGFTALPGGANWNGSLAEVGTVAYIWTSTNHASRRITWFESYSGRTVYNNGTYYLSVRCIKD